MIEKIHTLNCRPFPPKWNEEKTINKLIQASQNVIHQYKEGENTMAEGITEEGLHIRLIISPEEDLISAYPLFTEK